MNLAEFNELDETKALLPVQAIRGMFDMRQIGRCSLSRRSCPETIHGSICEESRQAQECSTVVGNSSRCTSAWSRRANDLALRERYLRGNVRESTGSTSRVRQDQE